MASAYRGDGKWTSELLDRKRHRLPGSWRDNGARADVGPQEVTYYAVAVCHETYLKTKPISRTELTATESGTLFVLYVREDGERAVERAYEDEVLNQGGDLVIVPRCEYRENGRFWTTLAVDEERDPRAAPGGRDYDRVVEVDAEWAREQFEAVHGDVDGDVEEGEHD